MSDAELQDRVKELEGDVAETVAGSQLEGLVCTCMPKLKTRDFPSVYNVRQTSRNALHSILSLVRLPIPPLSHCLLSICYQDRQLLPGHCGENCGESFPWPCVSACYRQLLLIRACAT